MQESNDYVFMLFDKKLVSKVKHSTKSKEKIHAKEKEKATTMETKGLEVELETESQDRKIQEKEEDSDDDDSNQALIILKYFDIFKQKVIYIDAIICKKNCILNDLSNHFLNNIIVKSKIDSIVKLRELIEKNETKLDFTVYEEENAMDGKVNDLTIASKLNESIAKLNDGDILIFTLNRNNLNEKCYVYKKIDMAMKDFKARGGKFYSTVQAFCRSSDHSLEIVRQLLAEHPQIAAWLSQQAYSQRVLSQPESASQFLTSLILSQPMFRQIIDSITKRVDATWSL